MMKKSLREYLGLSIIVVFGFGCVCILGLNNLAHGQETPPEPKLAAASAEGQQAIEGFKLDARLACKLFAAEPDVGNPVALFVDQQGRLFVCETYRQVTGVEDNREHADWLDDDLAAQSVEDRIAYMKKFLGDKYKTYTENDDRIRLLVDTDKDGTADRVTVFANGFNSAEMGTGAGVLSYNGNVYYTCIPSLFLLKDDDQDGVSDSREVLHTGFGVRFAFRGHDMHGLIIGPDGRLYFSIGDRGYNINNGELKDPATGAVFRCELDGSNLEVVATGLRNPQELAFDNYGNLFTGDNNSDSGDKARWVYIVPGGDSGWRMYYQYMSDRGPFNREKIWYPYNMEETPAYIVPPIANLGDGPSGLTFYPGTGFGDLFKDTFLLCDFRGNASNSGIRSIRNESDGAFFKIKESRQPIWQTLATDIDFGPDGKLYMADWVFGWVGENKGRVYTFSDKENTDSQIVKQVATLLSEGLGDKSVGDLISLLSHQDRRVRQEAQFELVRKRAVEPLLNSAKDITKPLLHRLHSVWGLGQLARSERAQVSISAGSDKETKTSLFTKERMAEIKSLLNDAEPEIRGRVCEFLGDHGVPADIVSIAERLEDNDARVRYFAALAVGKRGSIEQFSAIEKMLSDNMDRDPILRHAGIMAFTNIASRDAAVISKLAAYADSNATPSVRIAACVALRKLKSDQVAAFLSDEPKIQLEAARAIYDAPIQAAMNQLAAQIKVTSNDAKPFLARVLYANAWLGTPENADAIATFAANQTVPLDLRIQAVKVLRNWANPPKRDPFMGQWRPRPARDQSVAANALAKYISDLTQGEQALVDEVVKTIGALKIDNADELLQSVVNNPSASSTAVANSLGSLFEIKSELAKPTLESLIEKFDSLPAAVAGKVIYLWIKSDPDGATNRVLKTVSNDKADAKVVQAVVQGLAGNIENGKTQKLIQRLVELAKLNRIPAEARLDVISVAEQSKVEAIQTAVAEYKESILKSSNPSSKYVDTLVGGDVERGGKVFFGKTEVSCVRCHKVDGVGGEVGPNLSDIGAKKTRQYLLDSIVQPNKEIADGYAQTIVMTDEGLLHTGIIKSETEEKLVLMDADGKLIEIEKEFIEGTKKGQSSMPADLIDKLSLKEVRDLIEYLKAQTSNEETAEGHAIQ